MLTFCSMLFGLSTQNGDRLAMPYSVRISATRRTLHDNKELFTKEAFYTMRANAPTPQRATATLFSLFPSLLCVVSPSLHYPTHKSTHNGSCAKTRSPASTQTSTSHLPTTSSVFVSLAMSATDGACLKAKAPSSKTTSSCSQPPRRSPPHGWSLALSLKSNP